jgi:hypothetical protein
MNDGRQIGRSFRTPTCRAEPDFETVSNRSRVETGLIERASLSTITAQSVGEESIVQGPGSNSWETTKRSATEEAAGIPLFKPAKNRTFPGVSSCLLLNRHQTESVQRVGVALLSSEPKPLHGLSVILRHTSAVVVQGLQDASCALARP